MNRVDYVALVTEQNHDAPRELPMIGTANTLHFILVSTWAFVGLHAATARAETIVRWGSTVDDGDLEFTLGTAAAASDSTHGSGIIANPQNVDLIVGESNLQKAGGEIVHTTTPNNTVDDTMTANDAIADDQYYQFSFTVGGLTAGQELVLDSFRYSTRRNSRGTARTGWRNSQLAIRIDDTSFAPSDLIGSVNVDPDILDIDSFTVASGMPTGLVNGNLVHFRLYAWGTDATGVGSHFNASTRLGAVFVTGTIATIAEPSSAICLTGLGIVSALRRRRGR